MTLDLQAIAQMSTVVLPIILAVIAALRSQITKHTDQISNLERLVMQHRIDLQREMVGRQEIERLGTVIDHLVSITEQTQARVERIAERMDKVR